MTKQRIAVLGGGLGAMSAVYGITSKPGWDADYDITVYQMGWRLGGKGASGRGPNARVQEHGLHIWLGFYENAFRVMREMLDELKTTNGVFHSIEEAFSPLRQIGIMDKYEDGWKPWIIKFPKRSGEIGSGETHSHDTVWDIIVLSLEEIAAWIENALGEIGAQHVTKADDHDGFISRFIHSVEHNMEAAAKAVGGALTGGILQAIVAFAKHLPKDAAQHHPTHHESLIAMLRHLIERLEHEIAHAVHENPTLRHVYALLDMMTAAFKGMLENWSAIDQDGLDVLDGHEFQEFLKLHGAADVNADIRTCGPLRDLYNLAFAYEEGDPARPNLAAGVALRGAVAILFCYKDAPAQRMMAGMGDTIFTPFYRLLQQRGVKFEFFHRLEEITWAPDGEAKLADKLRFGVQAKVKDGRAYDPFVNIKGLDCWPQAPLTDQLVEGEAIRKGPDGEGVHGWDGDWRGYDLEDFWTTWRNVDEVTLKLGEDFDLVILAIPPASHPYLAKSLVAAEPRWAKMVEDVVAIRTLAAQIWMKPTLAETGWPHGETLVAAYQEPFDTWVDMGHLLPVEDWPADDMPGGISYLCGSMKGVMPPRDEVGVTERADDEVEHIANEWLATASGALWPDISSDGALLPGQTVIRNDEAGEGYMKGQFWRANVSPSELYVASHAGTISSRLDAAESGFDNLIFAGDWTNNGVNAGCVEASVMSGLRASNAICGAPLLSDMVSYWSGSANKGGAK